MQLVKVFKTSELPDRVGMWFIKEVAMCRSLDRWLKQRGCKDNEQVLIEHG